MTTIDPRKQAGIGPLSLKDPNSIAYAWQLTDKIKRLYETKELTIQQWEQTLAEAERYRIYERVPPGQPYGAMDALLKAEIGVTQNQSFEHIKALGKNGNNQHSDNSGFDSIKPSPSYEGGTSAIYLTARIARDRPDILERMKAGEYTSVRQAALEAGIVKRRISIPLDPEGAARAIVTHFDTAHIQDLIWLLQEASHADH